ncbi:MAG: hypothetical protein Tsb0021_12320 [Chlamydiales bacterium]
MINKIITVFFVFIFTTASLIAGSDTFASYPRELSEAVQTIYKLDEARDFIAKVQEEGPVSIEINRHLPTKFNAFWDPDARKIFITQKRGRSLGSYILSIMFEMHNASVAKKQNILDQQVLHGTISKTKYVEEQEYLEYVNANNTAKLMDIGIAKGIFPPDAKGHYFPSFNTYFDIQKKYGHSAMHAKNFETLVNMKNRGIRSLRT